MLNLLTPVVFAQSSVSTPPGGVNVVVVAISPKLLSFCGKKGSMEPGTVLLQAEWETFLRQQAPASVSQY